MEQGALLSRVPPSGTPISLPPSTRGARGISCQMGTTPGSRFLARCVQLLLHCSGAPDSGKGPGFEHVGGFLFQHRRK